MWLAWLGAIAIGVSLGLLGSGGSIITVPVLMYLVGQPEKLAITGSLAVVGAIAVVGTMQAARRGEVRWASVLSFGLPGILGTQAGSWLGHHARGEWQLVLFAGVMLAAAVLMFRGSDYRPAPTPHPLALALQGLAVGALTGFVGVGGGFMIVPALVLLQGLPMRFAVGTSLAIIALNAWSGFSGHLWAAGGDPGLDWPVLAKVTAFGVAGSLLGSHLAKRVPQPVTRRLFAVALTLIAAFMLWETLPQLLSP